MTPPLIYEQAERGALGGAQGRILDDYVQVMPPLREMYGAKFNSGVIEDVRVRAYYPPTRELWTVTSYLKSLTWSDAVEQAAVSVSMEFDNSGGEVAKYLNRPGLIFFIETKAPGGNFKERLRVIAWETSVSDTRGGSLTVSAFDPLLHLQLAKATGLKYAKDKAHKSGWTASEIAADLCRVYKIPVAMAKPRPQKLKKGVKKSRSQPKGGSARLAKTKYRFEYNKASITLYEALLDIYAIDSEKSKANYFIEMEQGRLVIRTQRKAAAVLAVADGVNLRGATLSRSLTDVYASVVIAKGTGDKDKDGRPKQKGVDKTKPKLSKAAKKKALDARRKAARNTTRARKLGEPGKIASPKENQIASEMLFGRVTYAGRGRYGAVGDPDFNRAAAQTLSDRLSRARKTLTIQADGNVLIRQGDRIYVSIPLALDGTRVRHFRRELFVTEVTHMLTPGDYTMDITCSWREKEVAIKKPQIDGEAPKEEESDEATAAVGKTGVHSRDDLIALWKSVGGPENDAGIMADLALRESGGKPDANNAGLNSNGTVDHGLWQINDIWQRDPVVQQIGWANRYSAVANAKMAKRVYEVQGKTAWATYKGG